MKYLALIGGAVASLGTFLGWWTYTTDARFAARVNLVVVAAFIVVGAAVGLVVFVRYGLPAFWYSADAWSRLQDARVERQVKLTHLNRYAPSSTGMYELPASAVEAGAFHRAMELAVVHSQYEEPRVALGAPPALLTDTPDTAVLELPGDVHLRDHLHQTGGRFALGMQPDGELLTLALPDVWHLLNNAQSGGGKSNNIDSFITQVHYLPHEHTVQMYGMDFKGELRATWKRSPLFAELATQAELSAMVDIAEGLVDTIHKRNICFEHYADRSGRIVKGYRDYTRLSHDTMPLVYLVVDEMNALMGYAKKDARLESALGVVLQMGRSAGVNVLMGAQHLTADVLPKGYYTNIATRVMLGQYDASNTSRLLGGKPAAELLPLVTGQPGRALVRANGSAAPVAVQMLKVDESDILGAIAHVGGAQPAETLLSDLLETMPNLESVKPKVSASESGETNFSVNPEVAEIVRRLKVSGLSKVQIIEAVWGARPGGTRAYKDAQHAYEQAVNQ